MKKRRSVSISLCAVLLLSLLLTACGGSANEQSSSGSGEGGNEQVTIKFFHWYDDKIEGFDKLIAEFEKQHPNIKVESVVGVLNDANETMKKIDLAIASGEELDVMIMNNPTAYAQRAAIDVLEPLDEYLEKDGQTFNDEYQVDTAIDGKHYAFPGKVNQYFVMLNKDQLDAAGLPVPTEWTWDEYLDYAQKLTKGEGPSKQYGTYFHTWVDYSMLPLMGQLENNNVIKSDGTPNVDNDLFRQGLAIRDRAAKEGSAVPYEDTISQKLHYRNVFMNGQASMLMIGSWMITEAAGNGPIKQNFKTAFAPYPTAKAGDPIASKADGDFVTVYAKSKHKQEAYTFAKWFTTEGMELQGKYLNGWAKSDSQALIDKMTSGPDAEKLIDKESLLHVLDATKLAKMYISVPYQEELDKALMNEMEKMLLGAQDLDTAVTNAQTNIKNLISANQ
ncbi:ABC transporter substrate-binding protein [Paenibacillus massiliensis]|uniref:ABC transporter substrate-binding protein n=1 Tax=Paenibacillus massiliensis TaxID=225917 RepID=UPI000471963D|nr:sugar ABC transporter substrate-binding protein [Paenibacillus massiliensis]